MSSTILIDSACHKWRSMSDQLTTVWEALLDAEMNVRYWGYLAKRFAGREKSLKIALALTTSSTILSLPVWERLSYGSIVLGLLGLLNAVLACILPILNYSERIETMANLRGAWSQLSIELARLWERESSSSISDSENEFRLLMERTVSLVVLESRLPNDRILVRKCQMEVRRSRGLMDSPHGENQNGK